MIKTNTFKGEHPGPRLIIFGGIHGDEVCGPLAIQKVIADLQSDHLQLRSGVVVFVPVANPEAFKQGKRLVEENLNRIFRKTDMPTSYEARLANELCAIIDGADAFLDIHSSSAPGPVNLFIDYPEERNLELANALDAEYGILDWVKAYEGNEHGFPSYSTNRYAHEVGAMDVLIECGQHGDPTAVMVAEDAILRTMTHLGLIKARNVQKKKTRRDVRMERIYAYEADGDRFTKDWHHLEDVPAGTCVAERATGERICVTTDSIIFFPKAHARPREEWFYLGAQA